MKTKTKLLISGLSVLGIAGVGATTYIAISSSSNNVGNSSSNEIANESGFNKPSFNSPTLNGNATQTTMFKVTPLEKGKIDENTEVQVSIFNSDTVDGNVTFLDGKTTAIAKPKDLLKIKVNYKVESKTLTKVEVYDKANPSIMLGVTKEKEKVDGKEIYSFILPDAKIEGIGGQLIENPFYITNKIEVKLTFNKKKINGWEFKFENGTSSGHYTYVVGSDGFVWDEDKNANLKMEKGNVNEPVQYRIDLNGYNLNIEKMVVKDGVQLMFINSKNDKKPVVNLNGVHEPGQKITGKLIVEGVVGRYDSVEYSRAVEALLNIRGWIN